MTAGPFYGGDQEKYERMAGRQRALGFAIQVATECGEMDTDTILKDAAQFADFMLDNKRSDDAATD